MADLMPSPGAWADRFAPSPTGWLHLGHAYSALVGHDAARGVGGRYHLRIDDLDAQRCRAEYVEGLHRDLDWLGVRFDGPAQVASTRGEAHRAGLARLAAMGLIYPCACSRREVAAAAPQEGAEGPVYPGTCRGRAVTGPAVLRLDLAAALAHARSPGHRETGEMPGWVTPDPDRLIAEVGDVVLWRREDAPAYHLACVLDDADLGVTRVTRGADLAAVTPLQVLLQTLLGLPTPVYHHHRLIRDDSGRRLAKRDDARSLASLRAAGWSPGDVRRAVGLS